MVKKHYHVLGGIHGCMPDWNAVYLTLNEARMGLRDCIRRARDCECKFSGNLKQGYFEEEKSRYSHYPNYYYEITECFEDECLEDLTEED